MKNLASGIKTKWRKTMARDGICPICGRRRNLTRHHVYRSSVWREIPKTQHKILLVCRKCHDLIELEITRRENEILQQHPDIYTGVVEDFFNHRGNYGKRRQANKAN